MRTAMIYFMGTVLVLSVPEIIIQHTTSFYRIPAMKSQV